MTALDAAYDRDCKKGDVQSIPLDGGADVFYKGGIMCNDTSGYAVPGTDTTGYYFRGVAVETVTQATGVTDGTNELRVDKVGEFEFAIATFAITDVGAIVYCIDDNTVGLTGVGSDYVAVGKVSEYVSATIARVRIDGYAV